VGFPQPRGEFRDTGGGVLANTLQYIDEIGVRIDAVQTTGDDQALHDADVLGTELSPTEIPVLPPHRNRAQRALQMVRVDRHVRVSEEYLQAQAALAHVVQRLDEWTARQQPLPLELAIDPVEKRIDPRLAVRQSMQALALGGELAFANLLLDRIERPDLLERFADPLRIGRLSVEERSSGMCIIWPAR
jgi:hypothetical protein